MYGRAAFQSAYFSVPSFQVYPQLPTQHQHQQLTTLQYMGDENSADSTADFRKQELQSPGGQMSKLVLNLSQLRRESNCPAPWRKSRDYEEESITSNQEIDGNPDWSPSSSMMLEANNIWITYKLSHSSQKCSKSKKKKSHVKYGRRIFCEKPETVIKLK